MAQKFETEGAPLAESPAPINPSESPDSIHPGLRPSLAKVPVTPGIHLGEYDINNDINRPGTSSSAGYFAHGLQQSQDSMAQSPSDAASGAKTNHDVLRRMSLSNAAGRKRGNSITLSELDPRGAYPSLNLSGGVISATFCIPHSLGFRKGADWVCDPRPVVAASANLIADSRLSSRDVSFI